MEMSETIGALAKALAGAQAEIGGAKKGKVNPAFKSKYADLAAVWDAWQEVGPAAGLAVTQFPGAFSEGKTRVTSMLMHESGEWLRDTLEIPVSKQDAQGCGSGITYARRFALAAIVGIAPEDDDGAAAVQRPRQPRGEVVPMTPREPMAYAPVTEGPCKTKAELKTALLKFKADLEVAEHDDQVRLIAAHAGHIAQCVAILPTWWNGLDGGGGFKHLLEDMGVVVNDDGTLDPGYLERAPLNILRAG